MCQKPLPRGWAASGGSLPSEDEDRAGRGPHEAWGPIGEEEGEPVCREERDGEKN